MAIWLGAGCLSFGGDKKVFPGKTIPVDALTPERLQEFVGKGQAEFEESDLELEKPKSKSKCRRRKKDV